MSQVAPDCFELRVRSGEVAPLGEVGGGCRRADELGVGEPMQR